MHALATLSAQHRSGSVRVCKSDLIGWYRVGASRAAYAQKGSHAETATDGVAHKAVNAGSGLI